MSSRGREVLARPLRRFFGALGQQPLVNVALHVGLHRRPFHRVDQVHDQPAQRGRVLNLGPGLLEDFAEHPRLLAEFFEAVPVVRFQLVAVPLQQVPPAEFRRHDGRPVVRRLGQFVGHLEEEQEGDLLRVGHVRQAVVAQDVGEVPGFADDLLGVVAHLAVRSLMSPTVSRNFPASLICSCVTCHPNSGISFANSFTVTVCLCCFVFSMKRKYAFAAMDSLT